MRLFLGPIEERETKNLSKIKEVGVVQIPNVTHTHYRALYSVLCICMQDFRYLIFLQI